MKLQTAALLLAVLMIASCKKDSHDNNDPEPDQDCRVVKYRCESRNETWRIVYDGAGRIDSILIGNAQKVEETRTLHYNQNDHTIKVKRFYESTPAEESVVQCDATGKILSIRDLGSNSSWKQVNFTYNTDAQPLLQKDFLSFSGTTTTYDEAFEWNFVNNPKAINLHKFASNSGVYIYSYFLDKPTQAGDFMNFDKLISTYDWHYRPASSSSLLKGITKDGDPLVDVDYTFDDKGKITRFAVHYNGNPTPEVWDLTYECK